MKKALSTLLTLCFLTGVASAETWAAEAVIAPAWTVGSTSQPQSERVPTDSEVQTALLAMKDQYPEGTPWTNDNFYQWNGYGAYTIHAGGYGCTAFACMMSDAAFGTLPARSVAASFDTIRIGDILRMNHDTHEVIVIDKDSGGVTVAEGNYNRQVHWGRRLTPEQVNGGDYVFTRYPEAALFGGFADVSEDAYYADAVLWAVENGVTSGTSDTTFSPDQNCTVAQILTFLWRAAGSPEVHGVLEGVDPNAYYAQAAVWAAEKGMIETLQADALCTRSMAVRFIWLASGGPQAGNVPFTDVPAHAPYAQAVAWAVSRNITSGTSDTTFSPDAVCTRGHIVTFLHRAFAE